MNQIVKPGLTREMSHFRFVIIINTNYQQFLQEIKKISSF